MGVSIAPNFKSKSRKELSHVLHLVDTWTECGNAAPTGAVIDINNTGAYFTIGDPVSKWGCACVGANPTLWSDTVTGYVYVAEDATSLCGASPDEGRQLEVVGSATCSGFKTPIDKCYDLAWAGNAIVDQV